MTIHLSAGDAETVPPAAVAAVQCGNLRCANSFLPNAFGKEFCCTACKIEFYNLMKSVLLPAIKLLVEYRSGNRWSKAERKRRAKVRERTGTPMPPPRDRMLFGKAMTMIDDFVAQERRVAKGEAAPEKYRRNRFRD